MSAPTEESREERRARLKRVESNWHRRWLRPETITTDDARHDAEDAMHQAIAVAHVSSLFQVMFDRDDDEDDDWPPT